MKFKRMLRDRDFLRTVEGLFFCVVDYIHPDDRVTAYLRYVPSDSGLWGEDRKYARVMPYYHVRNVIKTFEILSKRYPHYVSFCPVRNIRMSMVPHSYIEEVYLPEDRLNEILESEDLDPLERQVVDLISTLTEISGVKPSHMGVTGSVLIHIHRPEFSDIDLTVYGRKNAEMLKKAMKEALDESQDVTPIKESLKREWIEQIVGSFKIDRSYATWLANNRWNYAIFRGRPFSIHPVRRDEEITERYGDKKYFPKGICKLKALVTNADESIFMPAIYQVEVVEGKGVCSEVTEVVSYEGLFRDVAQKHDVIEVIGKLERVVTESGEHLRVAVGTGEVAGYIRPVELK